MPTMTKTRPKTAVKTTAKVKTPGAKGRARSTNATRVSLDEAMNTLERAGTAQTKKTWLRHGAKEPVFGVSFAALKALAKRVGVDHELARGLWKTGNVDALNLAVKVADPEQMTSAELDRWARDARARMCRGYVAMLAAEGAHGAAKAKQWLGSTDGALRQSGWWLVGHMAMIDETKPDDWFLGRVVEIEKSIHSASNEQREPMNAALIAIGCRTTALRKAATAAAKRIGKVEIDHGDTACKTPDAAQAIAKAWEHSLSKGFESPAAHERSREKLRTRC
jgi:3-methyladenine DNA glycosylase AlkD